MSQVQIGFNQRIQLEWLERTSSLVLAGSTREEILAALRGLLSDQISIGGDAERSNREKAITILLRIWATVPDGLRSFRDDGLQLLQRLPAHEHLPLHWGMSMAVYPFFGSVAEVVGRLLRLQGSVPARQAQRRIREQLGERETVARAARRVLRCFVDWDVLRDTERKGVYSAAPVHNIDDLQLKAWLVEAVLRASGAASAPVKALVQTPALFPFALGSPNGSLLRASGRLELFRQGLDQDVVTLCTNGGAAGSGHATESEGQGTLW